MSAGVVRARWGDGRLVAFLVVGSLVIGWTGNLFRAAPLPLVYRDPATRLEATLPRAERAPDLAPAAAELSLPAFQRMVQGGRQLILDARPAIFFRQGHVPGALNLPRDDFSAGYERLRVRLEGARAEQIAVYCSDDSCEDSHLVQTALLKLGYRRVAVYPGGWAEWNEAGLPKEIPAP